MDTFSYKGSKYIKKTVKYNEVINLAANTNFILVFAPSPIHHYYFGSYTDAGVIAAAAVVPRVSNEIAIWDQPDGNEYELISDFQSWKLLSSEYQLDSISSSLVTDGYYESYTCPSIKFKDLENFNTEVGQIGYVSLCQNYLNKLVQRDKSVNGLYNVRALSRLPQAFKLNKFQNTNEFQTFQVNNVYPEDDFYEFNFKNIHSQMYDRNFSTNVIHIHTKSAISITLTFHNEYLCVPEVGYKVNSFIS